MSEKRIVIKRKEVPQYVRFGTCLNCGTEIAIIGNLCEIEDYYRIDCENCNTIFSVPIGFPHKVNSWYAKRKLKKVGKNESKD